MVVAFGAELGRHPAEGRERTASTAERDDGEVVTHGASASASAGPGRNPRLCAAQVTLVQHHQGGEEEQPGHDGEDRTGHADIAEVAAHDHRHHRRVLIGLGGGGSLTRGRRPPAPRPAAPG